MRREQFTAFRLTEQDGTIRAGFVDCSTDDLDPGDVLVRVAYSGVNFKDALAATGEGKILRRPSCIGGIDFSGTVATSGDARFAAGDAVLATGFGLGESHHGGYAEYARVPGDWLIKLPAGMTLWEAMALGTAGFTVALAITGLEHHGLEPSHGRVLVTGATGGVGSIAVAALARRGHQVVALTGKADATAYLQTLGASEIQLRTSLDLSRIPPLGRGTWSGAIDMLGGPVLAWILSTTKPNGVVASVGLAASAELHTTVMPFILRGVSLLGINSSSSPSPAQRADAWRRLATDLRPASLDAIAQTIPFDQLPAVFERLTTGQTRGRIVVRIGA